MDMTKSAVALLARHIKQLQAPIHVEAMMGCIMEKQDLPALYYMYKAHDKAPLKHRENKLQHFSIIS